MTETEAATRVCPLRPDLQCVGAECMAWRWVDPIYHGAHRRGYCGMAGQPYTEAHFPEDL